MNELQFYIAEQNFHTVQVMSYLLYTLVRILSTLVSVHIFI